MSAESMMPSKHLIIYCQVLFLPSVFPRVFSNESAICIRWPKNWSFSFTSILPMNIQGWFPLGLTGLISLQSKGLSRVFSNTAVQKHQFFLAVSLLCRLTLTAVYDYQKNHSFEYTDLCQHRKWKKANAGTSAVHFSCSVVSDSLRPHELQPGLRVHHQLPEFTQTHVHPVGDAIQPSHPLSSPSPPAPNSSQHQSLFQ